MARKLIIAGNWKMNHNAAAAAQTVAALKDKVADVACIDIVVCPTFTSLAAATAAAQGSNIAVGAQNIHWADSGAFTGEISADMLAELGVEYAIIGHSERRQYFGETNKGVNDRLLAALAAGLKPIVCVGETLAQREAGDTEAVVGDHVRGGLAGLTPEQAAATVLAYEPVWAIGTGVTASSAQAQEVHAFIRGLLGELFGDVAAQIRLQYGGSVKAANVAELMASEDIDGALVGGASLTADDFSDLIHNAV